MCVPGEKREEFLARAEVKNRIEVPVLVRWKDRESMKA
jgi:hypothetical protein